MSFEKGLKNPMNNLLIRQQVSNSLKETHQNKIFGFKKGNKTKSQFTKDDWKNPDYVERVLNKIIQETNPFCYEFTGHGSKSIEGKIPDFVYQNKKKIIELFGKHWHSDEDILKRIEHFRKAGYDSLIIWENEIRDIDALKFKIWNFTNNSCSVNLLFSEKAYLKLKYYVRNIETEISGLGSCLILTPSLIEVTDLEIYPQVCSVSHSNLDSDFLAKVLYQKIKNNEDVSNFKVWFHSHASSVSFWSTIDEFTINNTSSDSFLISIVTNKKMEILGRLDLFKPLRMTISLNIMQRKTKDNIDLENKCQKEISEKVKTRSLISTLRDKKRFSIPKSSKNR